MIIKKNFKWTLIKYDYRSHLDNDVTVLNLFYQISKGKKTSFVAGTH